MDPLLPFPALPTELVIRILHIAASTSHSSAHSISLVSTWARRVALPYLFSTIVYRSAPSYSSGMSSGSKASPHQRTLESRQWGSLVRSLWIQSSGINNSANECQLLRAFYNVEHVALYSTTLRSLASTIQQYNAERRQRIASGSTAPPPAFTNLHSITLITNTFRYDWHFLLGLTLWDGPPLLQNITHLRIHDMTVSAFCPHNMLPNLTHLAVPFLDLGNDWKQDSSALRLPDGVLEHRALLMLVLTVDTHKWLTNPWYQIARYPGAGGGGPRDAESPRAMFRTLVQTARQRDERIHVMLAPRLDSGGACAEWAEAARGGASVWEAAAIARAENSHGAELPETYPKVAHR